MAYESSVVGCAHEVKIGAAINHEKNSCEVYVNTSSFLFLAFLFNSRKFKNKIDEVWSNWYCSIYVLMMRDHIVFQPAKWFIRTTLACHICENHHLESSKIEIDFKTRQSSKDMHHFRCEWFNVLNAFDVLSRWFSVCSWCFLYCLFLLNWRRQDINHVLGDIVKRDIGIVSKGLCTRAKTNCNNINSNNRDATANYFTVFSMHFADTSLFVSVCAFNQQRDNVSKI